MALTEFLPVLQIFQGSLKQCWVFSWSIVYSSTSHGTIYQLPCFVSKETFQLVWPFESSIKQTFSCLPKNFAWTQPFRFFHCWRNDHAALLLIAKVCLDPTMLQSYFFCWSAWTQSILPSYPMLTSDHHAVLSVANLCLAPTILHQTIMLLYTLPISAWIWTSCSRTCYWSLPGPNLPIANLCLDLIIPSS